MLYLLYIISIAALLALLTNIASWAKILKIPKTIAIFVTSTFALYLASAIPGLLGILNWLTAGLTLTFISTLGWLVTRQKPNPGIIPAISITRDYSLPNNASNWLVLLIGLYWLADVKTFVDDCFYYLQFGHLSFCWDAMSYHIPGWIEYFQSGSLWQNYGPYRTHCFGYELIAGYSALFFRSFLAFFLTYIYTTAFCLFTLISLTNNLLDRLQQAAYPINRLATLVFAIGALSKTTDLSHNGIIGKNDPFAAACIISCLLLIFLWRESQNYPYRRSAALLLSSLALALACATKPQMILFLPFFALMLFEFPNQRPYTLSNALYPWIKRAAILTAITITCGEIFLVINLVRSGHIATPSVMATGFQRSLLYFYQTGRLSSLSKGFLYYWPAFFALIAPFSTLFLVTRKRLSQQTRVTLLWLFCFLLLAFAIFFVTPYVATGPTRFVSRLGLPLFVPTMAIIATTIGYLCSNTPPSPRQAKIMIGLLMAMPFLLQITAVQRQTIEQSSDTEKVVKLLNQLTKNASHRIYAAGARPYILYGQHWKNQVFYDLNIHRLQPNRLQEIMDSFVPDIIVIDGNLNAIGYYELRKWCLTLTNFSLLYTDNQRFTIFTNDQPLASAQPYKNLPEMLP